MLLIFTLGTQTNAIISMAVGCFVNWLLHGVLTVQLYLYYLAFPNDRKWTKVAVYMVYILETVQVICYGFILLNITLPSKVGGGNHKSVFHYSPAWVAQAALMALASSLVPLIAQCIYAHRIRIITQRKILAGLIITLSILQFSAAVASTMPSIATIVLMVSAGINVVNDIIIAFIMVRSLWKNKPLSDHIRMKVIRLIQLIVATGSLTAAANSLFLASLPFGINFYYPSNGDLVAMPVLIFLPKLYANSILVMLNNRMAIRDSRNATTNTSTNVVSVLVIADHQSGPSGSAMSSDEIPFSSSAATSAI